MGWTGLLETKERHTCCFVELLEMFSVSKGHVTWLSIDVDGKNEASDTLSCKIWYKSSGCQAPKSTIKEVI